MDGRPRVSQSLKPALFWGRILVASGCLLGVVASLCFSWAEARITLKGFFPLLSGELKTTVKLTEITWMAVLAVSIAGACLAGLLWKRFSGAIAIASSVLLLAIFFAYLVELINRAYEALGLYDRALEVVRSVPYLGKALESYIREHVAFSARPQAGLFLFLSAALLVLAGGIAIKSQAAGTEPASSPRSPGI